MNRAECVEVLKSANFIGSFYDRKRIEEAITMAVEVLTKEEVNNQIQKER